MATRFYLTSLDNEAPITPALDSGYWFNTSNSRRLVMSTTRRNSTMTTFNDNNMNASSDQYFGRSQFICPVPLAGGQTLPTSSTFYAVVRAQEEQSTDNAYLDYNLRILNSSGTERSSNGYTTGTEMSSTALTARGVTSDTYGTNQSLSAGDYVCFEVGYDINSTHTDCDFTISFGDDAASDLTDGSTTANNPYVEVNFDFDFQSTGVNNQLMMVGVGK